MSCTPQGTTTTNLGLCKPQAGENNWAAAINGNWDILDTYAPAIQAYRAGLTLSTAGGSSTITTASGAATDTTNARMMTLGSSLNKTTAAWAVGTGNGGLDTGSIAASTWYHLWLILRSDTGVVDVLISLSATAPTMPASYNFKRRIGSAFTDGSKNWTKFFQNNITFAWDVVVSDANTTNIGTSAVTQALTVPTGISVFPDIIVATDNSGTNHSLLVTALSQTDTAPTSTLYTIPLIEGGAQILPVSVTTVPTNTNAQIRVRQSASGAGDKFQITTRGWIDFQLILGT